MELDEAFRILPLCVIDARGLGRIRTDDCAYAARDNIRGWCWRLVVSLIAFVIGLPQVATVLGPLEDRFPRFDGLYYKWYTVHYEVRFMEGTDRLLLRGLPG